MFFYNKPFCKEAHDRKQNRTDAMGTQQQVFMGGKTENQPTNQQLTQFCFCFVML